MPILLVGVGGVFGALLRYQLTRWISVRYVVSFPLATLLINVTGSFLLGIFTRHLGAWFPELQDGPMLLFGTGFCGAYTTFSTFTYESVILFREKRLVTLWLYLSLSIPLGFAAAAIGLFGLR